MLSRCYVAEESSSAHRSDSSTDSSCDMVISRCDISYKRSKYIERSALADGLLYLHICSDLVKRYMSRPLDHYLYILLPGTLSQLTKSYQLIDLADISSVSKAARSAGIAKRNRHIVLSTDIQDFIEVRIERVLLTCHRHPGIDK